MSLRKAVLAITVIGLSWAVPASAGTVVRGAVGGGADEVTGKCTYSGQTGLDGSMRFVFGGTAVAGSTTEHQPELVDVTCTLVSPPQGLPGEQPELRAAVGCNSGPVCVIPVGVADSWPARPVVVCISGHAAFSPNGSVVREIDQSCSSATV